MKEEEEISHDLNNIDGRINDRGFFERILTEREKLDEEREKRLNERFEAQEKAVSAALAAQEKATSIALTSAEKAVDKAEQAQLRVNVTQNEFRGTLKDQAADLMPRSETELLVSDLRTQIQGLRGTRREGVALSANVFVSALVVMSIVAGLLGHFIH